MGANVEYVKQNNDSRLLQCEPAVSVKLNLKITNCQSASRTCSQPTRMCNIYEKVKSRGSREVVINEDIWESEGHMTAAKMSSQGKCHQK